MEEGRGNCGACDSRSYWSTSAHRGSPRWPPESLMLSGTPVRHAGSRRLHRQILEHGWIPVPAAQATSPQRNTERGSARSSQFSRWSHLPNRNVTHSVRFCMHPTQRAKNPVADR